MLEAEKLVKSIIANDSVHLKKRTRPSDWSDRDVVQHLRNEVNELADEIVSGNREAAIFELADVAAVVLHMKERLGLSLADLDEYAVIKLRARFDV